MGDLNWIWQTLIIFFGGKFILRIAGRKSISQMTITQVVVMVGIGTLLIQPIAGEDIFRTLAVGLLITILMIITEYLETKFDIFETLSTGKAKIVIENGQVDLKSLKKLRMSVDMLETCLRQAGISSIQDVKFATIEISGQLGYELVDNKKPATKEDLNLLLNEIAELKRHMGQYTQYTTTISQTKQVQNHSNIFTEVRSKEFEGRNEP